MTTNKLRTVMALPLVGLAVLGLTACSSGRPNAEDLKNAIEQNVDTAQLTDEQKDSFGCVAEHLHDSDLSDEQLRKFIEASKDKETADKVAEEMSDAEQQEYTEAINAAAEACMPTP